ncbi:MAG: APA family basic amino acid/polyamine antiporter [Enterobacterales bacterium]|jgi:APA family basic amino acid/polyamine antiporter
MSTKHGLNKNLKRLDTLALAFGAMIGWSWVALITGIIGRGGSVGGLIATAVVGVVILAIGLIYAELASAMPDVGGEHVYSKRALGGSGSFICTWSIVFVYVAVCAFEAVALPSVLSGLFPNLGSTVLWSVNEADVFLELALIGAVTSALITWVNIRGIKLAAIIQTIVVGVILLAGLMLIVGISSSGKVENMQPLYVGGMGGILAAMALVPFMMTGFDVIPQAAEEINLPPRKIGVLLVMSIVFAVLWYIMIELAVSTLLSGEGRAASSLGVIDAAEAAFGEKGKIFLLIAGLAGILTSWNSFLIGGSRAIYAMAQDGMLPSFLAKVHPKYKTPSNAILFIGLIGVGAPLLGRTALVWFVDAGSFSLMIAYLLVAVSFIILRKREPEMIRPFRASGGIFLGAFGVIASLGMAALYLPSMPAALIWPQEWLMVLAWFSLGAMSYWWIYLPYKKKNQ